MAFVIAGVSGNTGSIVAETLLARRENVRVVLRDPSQAALWTARGAEVAIADLGDAPTLSRALRGAHGAYLLIPPSFTASSLRAHQTRVARSLAAAAAESGVAHIVFLSGFAAHHDRGSGPLAGLHDAELLLEAVPGLRLSSIRAGYFYENVFPVLSVVKDAGVLPSFFPADLPVPMVGTRDIGLLAADLTNAYVELITGIRSGALAFEGKHRRVEARTPLDAVLRPRIAG